MVIRLIEAGAVSCLRSQTIYHGLAYARTQATPPTIVLATPAEPYVCVGFHQNIEAEIDLEYCASQGLPVLRRETGGGAVYLDSNQLFVQWVMGSDELPARLDRRFALFLEPMVKTYRSYGIQAQVHPINDVHVDGRKIVGTGAAHIGNAEVLVGNFIFDFDKDAMARVLKVPSAAFRREVRASLEEYMASARHVCGEALDPQAVAATYIEACGQALKAPLEPGTLTEEEEDAIATMDARLSASTFQQGGDGLRRPGLKIHEDVYVAEATCDSPEIRVTARIHTGHLESVTISGPGPVNTLADQIRGLQISREPITHAIRRWLHATGETSISEPALVDTILQLTTPHSSRATS